MNKETKEVLDYYTKDTEEKWNRLKSINFEYGDEKYIQRVRNHKILLDYIFKLQEENKQLNYIINEIEQLCLNEQIPDDYPEYNEFINVQNMSYDNIYEKIQKLKEKK